MLQNNPQLKSLIDKLWNKFWSGGISNPLTAIEQITYLIFIRSIDELDLKNKRDAEWTGEVFISDFSGTHKRLVKELNEKGEEIEVSKEISNEELRWSNFRQLPAEEMLQHIQQNVFPFVKELDKERAKLTQTMNNEIPDSDKEESEFVKHMKNAVFIIPSASLLVESVNIIEEIFHEIERDANENGQAFQDIQGDVYEMLLSEIATAGKNGQFRTPRHIIKLLTELVQPKLGEKIGDPACGTGGFLLGAYQYIISSLDKDGKYAIKDEDGFIRSSASGLLTQEVKDSLGGSFHGFDIDVTMVRLGLMNQMMHGITNPKIDYMDTLSKKFDHSELESYDTILANPPFTGSLNKGEIDQETLSLLNTTKTELLFIERIYTMLKDGGTAGIIIPQGVLFGTAKAFVDTRKIMIEQSQLKAVITLPSGVFKPYAGVATAILIFTKAGETDNVWFYGMENDGYSLDDKRTKIAKSDIHDIIEKYHNRNSAIENDRQAKYFLVNKTEIVENKYDLSFNTYKEERYEAIKYDEPKDILENLGVLEDQIQDELKQIKSLIV